jgi:hypothetical protein
MLFKDNMIYATVMFKADSQAFNLNYILYDNRIPFQITHLLS